MPRIQTFVSNQVREEVESIVQERRQEGATQADVTMSSISSMLIELGLRVYRIQREGKSNGFNQMEFNKIVLEMVSKSNALNSNAIRMLAKLPDLSMTENYKSILESVRLYSSEQVEKFFSSED